MAQNQNTSPALIELYARDILAVRNKIGLDWYFSGAGVLRNVAMSQVEIGDYAAAIARMEEAPSFPDLAVVMIATGLHALRKGDASQAEKMCREVEAKLAQWMNSPEDHGYGEVYSGLGALNALLGTTETAAAWWAKAADALEAPGLEGIVYDLRIPYAHAYWEAGLYDKALDVLLEGEADFEATLKTDYFVRIVGELLRMKRKKDVRRIVDFFTEEGETWAILEPAIRQTLQANDLESADFLLELAEGDAMEAGELVVSHLIREGNIAAAEARIRAALDAAKSGGVRSTWLYWLTQVVGEAAGPEIQAEYQLIMDAGRVEAAFDHLSEANAHLAAACAAIGMLEKAWNCVTALDALDSQIEAAIRLSDSIAQTQGIAIAKPHFERALALADTEEDADFRLILRARIIAGMGAHGHQEAAAKRFTQLRKDMLPQLGNEFVLHEVVHSQLRAHDLEGALATLRSVPAEVENGGLYETVAVATCQAHGLETALKIIQGMPFVVERMLAAGNCLQAASDVENFHWGWAPKEKVDD
ncbi:MAG TPA: hypothetical protein ENJ82_06755 [Bacteroidetes bacterium]|nr:hypothetical protein [Bacteroidota bacterium]